MKLIVGLGNPGSEYETTRHNIGFMVIDELLRRSSSQEVTKKSFNGNTYKSKTAIYLKPLTFMNLSGKSISKVKHFYKTNDTIIIHDDLDLPFGTLRFKFAGGHGGHNGLKSSDSAITKNYIRVRMGIGRPENKGEVSSFVLSSFSKDEQACLDEWIAKAADAVEELQVQNWEKVASLHSIKKSKCLKN
ncbi:aminoacyl-tRNA hydrolase [Sulfurimonas sp. MAG313]|nr:aminoacyl-tRNA hydrolase [Sulfurimonas sp. MAG313]MDF1880328.1 aminoacyl-tRNA hydrolase [Sulfurimonas sp. MAG313]